MLKKFLPRIKLLIVIAIALGKAYSQTPNGQMTFDVASIKAAPPPVPGRGMIMGMSGGPGSNDPGLYRCSNCNLTMLILQAYGIERYQLTGPDWMNGNDRFEVSAKVPKEATKAQFQLMLQNLLAERFKLTVHREKKEMQVYDLVVAKGGSKLIEHKEEPSKDADKDDDRPLPGLGRGRGGPNLDADGYPVVQKGCKGCIMIVGSGKARMQALDETMKEFVDMLASQIDKPVSDATGLTGKYDISLTYQMPMRGASRGGAAGSSPEASASSDDDTGVPLVGAIGPQLGLKLESKKGQVDMLVVDHAEKIPTEN